MTAYSKVLSASKCHTLDRSDFRAQKDSCGIGNNNDLWRFAVDKIYNVTYWPYIQNQNVYNCTSQFFGDSWYNLNLKDARLLTLKGAFIGLLVLVSTLVLF